MQQANLISNVVSDKNGINSVKHPTKKEYLDLVIQKSKQMGHYGYLGLYFSGNACWKTGDWVVASDDPQKEYDTISLEDILQCYRENKLRNYIWISVDAPHSGKWVLNMSRLSKDCSVVFSNFMVDSCTDLYGCAHWLVYSS